MLPKTADKITFACVWLHNFLMLEKKDGNEEYSQEIDGNRMYWSPVIVDAEQDNTQIAVTQ